MSRLIHKAPSTVVVDGVCLAVETDFRVCLQTVLALGDGTLTGEEKLDILLHNLFDQPPENPAEAARQGLAFLRCNKEAEGAANQPPLCDFAQDDGYIYAAMLKKGIDLDAVDTMHWWTFMAHFAELPESTFKRLVYLRSRQAQGKLSKEEKEEIAQYGQGVVTLANPQAEQHRRQAEQAAQEFETLLEGGGE